MSENLAVAYRPYTTLITFPSAVQNRFPVVLISLKILDFPHNVCGLIVKRFATMAGLLKNELCKIYHKKMVSQCHKCNFIFLISIYSMVKNTLKRKDLYLHCRLWSLPPQCREACNVSLPQHSVLLYLFVGYGRCTYGTFYHYYNTGFCCKISGTWYCTGISHSISECNLFAE